MADKTHISLMLAVPSAAAAADWYKRALGATDPFGHVWLVGDKSPLMPFPSQ